MNTNYYNKKIKSITGCQVDSTEMTITMVDDTKIVFSHHQDCCESVSIDDVIGDLRKHENAKLLDIIEKSNSDSINKEQEYESFTYTFYTIKTSRGYIDVRWFGSSNGYYSEGVDIEYK